MSDEQLKLITTYIVPFLTAAGGYMIKASLQKWKDKNNQINSERRVNYQEFVDYIIDILSSYKLNKDQPGISNLHNIYKKHLLYASPKVIKSFGEYFQYLYKHDSSNKEKDPAQFLKKLTKVIVVMRKDLGLSNKGLGNDGEEVLRAMINDFDKVMGKENK